MAQYPKSGLNNSAEYQIGGLPFATASTLETTSSVQQLSFSYVTKFVTVKNVGGPAPYSGTLFVGFTHSGTLGSNRYSLTPSASYTADFRLKDLFLMGETAPISYEVIAGLTLIEARQLPTLTGSAAAGVASASADLSIFGYPGLG